MASTSKPSMDPETYPTTAGVRFSVKRLSLDCDVALKMSPLDQNGQRAGFHRKLLIDKALFPNILHLHLSPKAK